MEKPMRVARTSRILLAIALIGTSVSVWQPVRAQTTQAGIDAANAKFSAAAAKSDGAAVAALYADDGQVMPPNSPPITGKDAIRTFWQGAFDSGVAGVGLKTVQLFGQGSHVTEVGEFELKDKGDKTLDHGKYIVVWKKEGSEWKLVRDMFSSNVPAAKK
jgi:uncharacterized protein (TIGR02246 family)